MEWAKKHKNELLDEWDLAGKNNPCLRLIPSNRRKIMFFDIVKAQYLDNYRVKLHFEDGSTGVADLSDYPDKTNVFQRFFDLEYFKNFQIVYGTLTWGNGDVDIAPETLYTITTGKPIVFDTIKRSEIK